MLKRKPRVNVYICDYNCLTKTVDVDKGVTPFMIPCTAKPRPDRPIKDKYLNKLGVCKGTARSTFYPMNYPKNVMDHITHEWYRLSDKEIEEKIEIVAGKSDEQTKESLRKAMREGPLSLRERTNAKPRYHSIIPQEVRIKINKVFCTFKGIISGSFVFK